MAEKKTKKKQFENPFIDHQLLAISLNSVSKWTARVLPSFKDYYNKNGDVDTQTLQMLCHRGFLDICAGYATAAVNQDFCQTGHTDAADADKINMLIFFECCHI